VTAGNNANNGIPGYSAGVGYDLATGWGSPDIAKLVAAFPGAAASTTPVNTTVSAGKPAAAGTFTITNTTSGTLNLQSVTINLSSPTLFSSLTLTATVSNNAPQVAAAVPSASSVFTFSPLVSIPSGGSATLVLQGLTVTRAPVGAAVTIASGASTSPRSGSGSSLPFSLAILLAWVFLVKPRWRMPYALAGLLLVGGLAMLTSSCGGGSNGASSAATQSSNQSIAQGGVNVGDGQGGIVEVSGLPAALGSVKVRF